jgi:membrane protease YdiL (CAAX protease family)
MSNALLVLAQASASAPTQSLLEQRVFALLIPCVVILFIWTLAKIIRPHPLRLDALSAPERDNTLNPLHVVIAFIVFTGVQYAVMQVLSQRAGLTIDREHPIPADIELQAALASQISLILVCLLIADMTFILKLGQGLGLATDRKFRQLARGIGGFLAIAPLVWLGMLIGQWIVPESLQHEHDLLRFLRGASSGWTVLTILSATILAPLAEEIFFRGLLQSMLRRYFHKPWLAIGITSVLFAAAHTPNYQDMLPLAIFALGLGYNYERSGRLWPSIIMHACLNGSAIYLAKTET